MKKWTLLLALFQATAVTSTSNVADVTPGLLRFIENRCVAVLTEAHSFKRPLPVAGFDPPVEVDEKGQEIIHVPEQTLKLRCK